MIETEEDLKYHANNEIAFFSLRAYNFLDEKAASIRDSKNLSTTWSNAAVPS